MPTTGAVAEGLIHELGIEEMALIVAHERYVEALNTVHVRLRKYAAVRDTVAQYLGTDPYSSEVRWPWSANHDMPSPEDRGRFRYAEMKLGDAATLALADGPLSVDDLILKLRRGGADYRGRTTVNARSVHAALINKAGVEKLDDDRFQLKPKEADPDDLVFE